MDRPRYIYRVKLKDVDEAIICGLARPGGGGVWIYDKAITPRWYPNHAIDWIEKAADDTGNGDPA